MLTFDFSLSSPIFREAAPVQGFVQCMYFFYFFFCIVKLLSNIVEAGPTQFISKLIGVLLHR